MACGPAIGGITADAIGGEPASPLKMPREANPVVSFSGKRPIPGNPAGGIVGTMNSDNPMPSDRSRTSETPRKLAPATPSPDPNPHLESPKPLRPERSAPRGDAVPADNPPVRSPSQKNT